MPQHDQESQHDASSLEEKQTQNKTSFPRETPEVDASISLSGFVSCALAAALPGFVARLRDFLVL